MLSCAFSLALHVVAAQATAAPIGAAPAHAKPRVIVLDFQTVGISAGEAGLLRDAVAARLGNIPAIQVTSTSEMKALVDVAATKQANGCDDAASAACLAEIAGALGADYVVAGNVGKLGDSVVLNLSLLGSRKAEAIKRASVTGSGLEDVVARLGPAVDELSAPLAGEAAPVNVGLWAGGIVTAAGTLALVGGAVWCAALEVTLESARGGAEAKQGALDTRVPALGTLALGIVGTGVGGAVVAASVLE